MRRRGIIMVRAQYGRDKKTRRRNMRTKTGDNLAGLIKYFEDANHDNHDGIRILPCRPWRTTLDAFVPAVVRAAETYREGIRGRSGKKWCGDIAEHIIAAPDECSNLSDADVERLAFRILERISPRSPAIWAAHFDEESMTWEIHIALSSFTDEVVPQLRVTELRRREAADYGLLLDEAGFVALAELNQRRGLDRLPPIRSLADVHNTKLTSAAEVLCRFEEASSAHTLSVSDLLALFHGSAWRVLKHTKTSVSLTSALFSTPLHVRLKTLRSITARLAESRYKEGPDCREDSKDNAPLR